MGDVVVIGAGMGGLSAALILASRGRKVRVLEAAATPGGKAGTATIDGVTFDTGPSVLTMPDVFDGLFAELGERLADRVTLRTPTPAFRYVWADGASLDLSPGLEGALASVRRAFGSLAEKELAGYLAYTRRIWEEGGERFVRGPSPGAHLLRPSNLLSLMAIDPLRTMTEAIVRYVREPHLRMLLQRYATYNGSDPRKTPATLGCIAHVELALGGFGVEGGIQALIRALVGACERAGVELSYGARVQRIAVSNGRCIGVDTARGYVSARAVVANTPLGPLVDVAPPTGIPSTSGWTAVVRAARRPRAAHAVVFPADYAAEFTDLFDRGRVPADPSVYACAQSAAHGNAGWTDTEPVFLMANAPAEVTPSDPSAWAPFRDAVLKRAVDAGLMSDGDPVVWERTPRQLAAQFPGTDGALYGLASHGAMAAFRRPANRTPIRGLYLASGSAHPGGGLPLCALSGRQAAEAVLADG